MVGRAGVRQLSAVWVSKQGGAPEKVVSASGAEEQRPLTVQRPSLPDGDTVPRKPLRNEWVSEDRVMGKRVREIGRGLRMSAQYILEETRRSPEKASTEDPTKKNSEMIPLKPRLYSYKALRVDLFSS